MNGTYNMGVKYKLLDQYCSRLGLTKFMIYLVD